MKFALRKVDFGDFTLRDDKVCFDSVSPLNLSASSVDLEGAFNSGKRRRYYQMMSVNVLI